MKIPKHIAIIMDGNGRWAKAKGLPRTQGHKEGASSVEIITKEALKLGVKYLTLYAFSTENWARPKTEILSLMKFRLFLRGKYDRLHLRPQYRLLLRYQYLK